MAHNESAAAILDDLAAAIAAAPPTTHGWTEDDYELYERFENEPDLPLTDGQRQRFVAPRARQQAAHRIEDLLRSLREAVRQVEASPSAALPKRCRHPWWLLQCSRATS